MKLQQGSHLTALPSPLLRPACRSQRSLGQAFGGQQAFGGKRYGQRTAQRQATRATAAGQPGGAPDAAGRTALYPAGKRQARLRLPALILQVDADSLLDSPAVVEELGAAVSGGATAVVLSEATAEAGPGGSSAARLYEAALKLKELLRGRSALVIRDRTDIADAVGADGVLLSPTGLPTVVAKRMLAGGLGLVGRAVSDAAAAAEAAAEGASFVVLSGGAAGVPPTPEEAVAARQQQKSNASIPVIVAASAAASSSELTELVVVRVDGLALDLTDLTPVAAALRQRPQSSTAMAAAAVLKTMGATPESVSYDDSFSSVSSVDIDELLFDRAPLDGDAAVDWQAVEVAAPAAAAAPLSPSLTPLLHRTPVQAAAALPPRVGELPPAAQLSQLLSASREALVEAERGLLTDLLGFLAEACPGMEEASLLRDALRQLDELFLLVVVGEFNSGGSRALA